MTQENLLERFDWLTKHKGVKKEFVQMAIGRHDSVGDGWRHITYKENNEIKKITLERSPNVYLIYSGDIRFDLGKDDRYEQMCINFDVELKNTDDTLTNLLFLFEGENIEVVTKENYNAAKKAVEKYTTQVNKSLVTPYICICCKKNEIKPLDGYSIEATKQDKGMWDDGTVTVISFGYGSRHDCSYFYLAMCDDCCTELQKEGLIKNCKVISKKQNAQLED